MDFHSLMRRDLQFLCKKNKIPANITNVAMADALNSLEIVEGLDEYMSQSNAKAPHSPTSVAKHHPKTASRTTRRKTTMKAEPQSSSQLVNRSCHLTNKSLVGEMEQENINTNVSQELKTNNVKFETKVAKTPAARSTRKATAATSCSSKVQESKKDELVQSVYSTRRSTRLLEKCMADLSLKTKETLDNKPAKNEDTEQKVSAQEKTPSVSEVKSEDAEVIPGRNLSASMEKEWETLKNDSDQEIGDLGDIAVIDADTETNKEKMNEDMSDEKAPESSLVQADKQEEREGSKENDNDQEMNDLETYVDLSDAAVSEANIETNKEKMNEVMSDEKESENSVIQVNKEEEETLQAMCEESSKKNDNDQEMGDLKIHGDLSVIPALQHANSESNNDIKESKNVLDQQEIEENIKENDSELEAVMDQRLSDAGESETELEEDTSGVDSDGTISEADSNQAVLGSDTPDEEKNIFISEASAAAPTSPSLLEDAKVKTIPLSPPSAAEQTLGDITVLEHANSDNKDSKDVQQEVEDAVQENDSEPEKINNFDGEALVDRTDSNAGDSETEQAEDNSDSDSEDNFSEADSNQAVMGSEIADEEMNLSGLVGSGDALSSPQNLEETKVRTTPVSSPFAVAAGPVSIQFPRPSKSTTTTPLKNSALKMVNVNKENNMEMMMNVNIGESKGEARKEKKKVGINEEKLKDASMRQLVKMVKELSIQSSNRTALQILPGNNQIAE